ncbi:hypothetical protein NVP1171O_22 [Vibrio phage 1.171.O._10N.261.52.F12]|nr:hypothetical protein NVP1160O_23 [Vibrio phage 1.160.O._10N.261.48.B11]AUR92349.1 hypothetical protein NVP1171O_22 [Vibrio phage 1.171.O._10N.261.52.F12]
MVEIKELNKCLPYLYGSDADFMVEGLRGTTHLKYDETVEMCCPHRTYSYTVGSLLSSLGCGHCLNVAYRNREQNNKISSLINKHETVYKQLKSARTREKRLQQSTEHSEVMRVKFSECEHPNAGNSHNLKYDTESFILKARAVHIGRYSYDRAVYTTCYNRLVVTCPEHGDFEQNAGNHLYGAGCPKCATHGFNPDKRAYLYILLDTETHSRVKIGISNVPDTRLRDLKRNTPFTLERIDLFETLPTVTLQIEKFCHSQLESANLTGFDGATEWFKFDGGKLEALRAFILSTGGVSVG